MSQVIRFEMLEQGRQTLARHGGRADRLFTHVNKALGQGLVEIENHLKTNLLRGGSLAVKRGGSLPVASRSGTLNQSIVSKVDRPLSGFVGSVSGPASRYAKVILGAGTTTIKPKRAKHLWIPVGDNLTASGQTRISPRAAMAMQDDRGKRLLRIFKSKAGNLVAFLKEPGVFKRGKKKGLSKGKLLFVLKDSVQVKGTDALAKSVKDKRERLTVLLQESVRASLE